MNACVGTFAAGIQPGDICTCIGIHVYAAHKIVVARENRDKVFGHIYPGVQEILIYHREAVSDKVGVFMCDVKIELV